MPAIAQFSPNLLVVLLFQCFQFLIKQPVLASAVALRPVVRILFIALGPSLFRIVLVQALAPFQSNLLVVPFQQHIELAIVGTLARPLLALSSAIPQSPDLVFAVVLRPVVRVPQTRVAFSVRIVV